MSNQELLELLRNWYERPFAVQVEPCSTGPSFCAIVAHADTGFGLAPNAVEHVDRCTRCSITLRAARSQTRDDPLVHAVSAEESTGGATFVGIAGRVLLRPRTRRMVLGLGGFAVAAGVVMAVIIGYGWRAQQAFAQLATAVAQQPIDASLLESLLAATDPAVARRLAAEIADATQRRDSALARLSDATASGDKAAANKAANDLIWARVHRYRGFRDVAQFDAALVECQTAIQEATQRLPDPNWLRWLCIHLDDLGSIYAASGDYGSAREAYRQSITRRHELVGEPTTANRIMDGANSLTPLFWRLSYLSMAAGDFAGAQQWLDESESALRPYFAGVCKASGIHPVDPATLLDAYHAMPPEYQRPPEWPTPEDEKQFDALAPQHGGLRPASHIVIKLREHLFRVARLRRVQGDFRAASEALEAARSLPYYHDREESRLDFFEPLEAARIAIAQARYDVALNELAAAEKGIDQPNFYGRPLGVVARAEFDMLKGVALLGLDQKSTEGTRLVDRAMALLEKLGSRLNGARHDALLRQFSDWQQLLHWIRSTHITRTQPL